MRLWGHDAIRHLLDIQANLPHAHCLWSRALNLFSLRKLDGELASFFDLDNWLVHGNERV